MKMRIAADATFAQDGFVINASQVMFEIRIASAPPAGPLALAELGARHGVLAGSFVQNDDGRDSKLRNLTIEEHLAQKALRGQGSLAATVPG